MYGNVVYDDELMTKNMRYERNNKLIHHITYSMRYLCGNWKNFGFFFSVPKFQKKNIDGTLRAQISNQDFNMARGKQKEQAQAKR